MAHFLRILILLLVSVHVQANSGTIEGLVCDDDNTSTKVDLDILIADENEEFAELTLRRSLRAILRMVTTTSNIQPILDNRLDGMNKKTIKDKESKASLQFRVDGYTFNREPTLEIKVKLPNQPQMVLSSCKPKLKGNYKLN